MEVAQYKVGDSVRNLMTDQEDGSAYIGKVISIFPIHHTDSSEQSYRTEIELQVGVRSSDTSRFGYQVEWHTGVSNPWAEDELEAAA